MAPHESHLMPGTLSFSPVRCRWIMLVVLEGVEGEAGRGAGALAAGSFEVVVIVGVGIHGRLKVAFAGGRVVVHRGLD